MRWQDHISADPDVCHGQPCVRGTRVMASVVLDNLASGESAEAVAKGYRISIDDVRACLLYAAELAKGRVIPLPAGAA